jgi:predicted Rossmann fold nucleotide-binding protein DprA/Smf involved in DNA uptake
MKVIIAGGRNFSNYKLLKDYCEIILDNYREIEIVSGGAKGADKFGELFASENNLVVNQFLPDWAKYGKAAGIKRNEYMAEYSDMLIAFWDGKSIGTKNMINLAKSNGLKVSVCKY